MQAFNSLFAHFGIGFAVPLIAVALAIGALAGMMAWLDGPSGAAQDRARAGYLPLLQKVNRKGIEIRILTGQAIVITVIALLYAFIPDVSRDYWIFAVMATQIYLIMYVLMFIAAVRLRRRQPDHARGYRAPCLSLLCAVGGVSSAVALVLGFIAPSQFGHSNRLLYALFVLGGILVIGIVPPVLMDRLGSRSGGSPERRRPPSSDLVRSPWRVARQHAPTRPTGSRNDS